MNTNIVVQNLIDVLEEGLDLGQIEKHDFLAYFSDANVDGWDFFDMHARDLPGLVITPATGRNLTVEFVLSVLYTYDKFMPILRHIDLESPCYLSLKLKLHKSGLYMLLIEPEQDMEF